MVAEPQVVHPPEPQHTAAHEGAVQRPLIVLAGPTGSGKSRLAITLAEALGGEIVSCDSVAVYRRLEIGSAKPSREDRERVRHYGLDLLDPDQPCTAGDYARAARQALAQVHARGCTPIVAGGTGLYLRALLEGLAPAPGRDEALRQKLRTRAEQKGSASLHRVLRRFDGRAAALIHPNDTPKLVRSLETYLLGKRPQTEQWKAGRDALHGYRVLRLGLTPPRDLLYERLNQRAAAMFNGGLLEETAALLERFGEECFALGSLGYAQAREVLAGRLTLPEAIAQTQQGHRNYAKRQLTWFRRDAKMHWLQGFGDDPQTVRQALEMCRVWIGAVA